MEKISCEVARDLLPLYCDQVCSQDSRKLVENHLNECPECRSLLTKMETDCRISANQEQHDAEIVKDMAAVWRKSNIRSFAKGIAVALCLCLLLVGGYWGLSRCAIVIVPPASIAATVESVTDELVTIHLETIDGKKVFYSGTTLTDDGKLYIFEKRGIIAFSTADGTNYTSDWGIPMQMNENGTVIQVNEIYYGSPNNCVLIWQRE